MAKITEYIDAHKELTKAVNLIYITSYDLDQEDLGELIRDQLIEIQLAFQDVVPDGYYWFNNSTLLPDDCMKLSDRGNTYVIKQNEMNWEE